jgi:isoamylase
VTHGEALLGHDPADPTRPSGADSAPYVPRSLVVSEQDYDWAGDTKPRHSYSGSVVYELHAKGFTERHPDVPPELRGSYAGLGHEAVTGYLRDLGVTAVELLPVHEYVPEGFLLDRGLTNYWGYNSIGYFAPHQAYSTAARSAPGGQVTEFRDMVKALHRAGLEVILDVVYNHTAEGNESGPTLCLRGLDNGAYYRLDPDDPSRYHDTTGTGNSLNAGDPRTLRMIMDSLRYWLTEMHVDGFRFDLAATLGRDEETGSFDQMSAFFDIVAQDPVVSAAKLIAEPWDVGQADSYDLGRFPAHWREWNGRYRDSMRDFWRGRDVGVAEFATRFSGSSDLYGAARRRPTASVNLLTVHDGFTARDLVSYDDKDNEANGEDNRDGTDDNRSWNCGVEGPTTDPGVNALRARQSRAMLSTLLLSFGLPMLLGGDEIGRTQGGNNNAYCQDNETSWVDWEAADDELRGYVRRLLALRGAHPVFRRQRFLTGAEAADLGWYSSAGEELTDRQWADPTMHAIAVYLDGCDAPDQAEDGTPLLDDDFLILVNGWREPVTFTLPPVRETTQTWFIELDSYDPAVSAARVFPRHTGDQVVARPRSLTVLRAPQAEKDETD